MRVCWTALAAGVGFALASPHARGQAGAVEAVAPHTEAMVRAAQARAAARRGETNEALRMFAESMHLEPTARVAREYALLLEQARRHREAAEAWTRLATLSPDPDDRDRALARSESLRLLPSLLRVRVIPGLAAREARVWFDHDPPRVIPTGGAESTVDGGRHRVRVVARGYAPFETMITTAYGEPAEVVAHLSPDDMTIGRY